MIEVFTVDGGRTPQGRYGGALAGVRPDDPAARAVRAGEASVAVAGGVDSMTRAQDKGGRVRQS